MHSTETASHPSNGSFFTWHLSSLKINWEGSALLISFLYTDLDRYGFLHYKPPGSFPVLLHLVMMSLLSLEIAQYCLLIKGRIIVSLVMSIFSPGCSTLNDNCSCRMSSSAPRSVPWVRILADDSLTCWNNSWKSARLLKPVGRQCMRSISMQYIKDAEMPQWCAHWHDQNSTLKMQNLTQRMPRCKKKNTNTNNNL